MTVDHMDIDYKLEAEGTLLWDIAGGHAHSFDMSGPSHVTMDMAMKLFPGRTEDEPRVRHELAGNDRLKSRSSDRPMMIGVTARG